jgi:hypothetical protein
MAALAMDDMPQTDHRQSGQQPDERLPEHHTLPSHSASAAQRAAHGSGLSSMRLWVVLEALAAEPAGVEADQHDQQCRPGPIGGQAVSRTCSSSGRVNRSVFFGG